MEVDGDAANGRLLLMKVELHLGVTDGSSLVTHVVDLESPDDNILPSELVSF